MNDLLVAVARRDYIEGSSDRPCLPVVSGSRPPYRVDRESIVARKRHVEHVVAQDRGRREWYERYEVRVARVERAYGGARATRSTS